MHRSLPARITRAPSLIRLAALSVLIAVGCGRSPTPRYYLLHQGEGAAARTKHNQLTVAIGPITFPAYLDRTDIVRRTSKTQLSLWTNHLWAERPVTNFSSVLADNLVALIGTARIVQHPWNSHILPSVTVRADVAQFEADSTGTVQLVVAWTVERAGRDAVVIRRSRYRVKAKGGTPELVMEAMSNALFAFSKDVANAVTEQGPDAAR